MIKKRKISSENLNSLRLAIRDKKQIVLTVSRSNPGDTFSDSVDYESVSDWAKPSMNAMLHPIPILQVK